jgi:DNA-binding CsgD family transcriptional regulator
MLARRCIVDRTKPKQDRLSQLTAGDRGGKDAAGPASDVDVPFPAALRASRVHLAGDEYVVLRLPAPAWDLPDCLTLAERDVALAVLRGATNEEIAGRRSTSVRTVAHQVASIFKKLAVSSRAELAYRLAPGTRRWGL